MLINRYNMTELICKAITKNMTMSNIVSSFRKTGVYTLVDTTPCTVFTGAETTDPAPENEATPTTLPELLQIKLPRSCPPNTR